MLDTPFEEIEPTADWALRVRGRTLPALFTAAARGMFSLLTDLSAVHPEVRLELDLRAFDTETLLVDWLNELLYRAEEKKIVFSVFDITALERTDPARPLDPARLRALVAGGPSRDLHKAIKAATFSGLSIRHDDAGYVTELVFDV